MRHAQVFLIIFPILVAGGCLNGGAPKLDVGGFHHRLAADPQAGQFLIFNFTIYNNGSGDAKEIRIDVDGLNRTPPNTNHYGRNQQTLQRIPPGKSFLVSGQLEAYRTCRVQNGDYDACQGGTVYITISLRPSNGPALIHAERGRTYS